MTDSQGKFWTKQLCGLFQPSYDKILKPKQKIWAVSSSVERYPDKIEVNGSTPLLPTFYSYSIYKEARPRLDAYATMIA